MPSAKRPEFDWHSLGARLIHPVKVAIIEALICVELPLSPTEMVKLFDRGEYYLSLVAYHSRSLAKAGALVEVDSRRARGAIEHFYVLSGELLLH